MRLLATAITLIFGVLTTGVLSTYSYAATTQQCHAVSGERRVPLLELYTSEGCDSCPPTDKWLSELPQRGFGTDRVVALSFHVDYWDYIGWRDPYAQARFSERQRSANARNGARQIYTPQLMLNGRDFRGGRNNIAGLLDEVSRGPAKAAIRLSAAPGPSQLDVSGAWSATDADTARLGQGWLALYENRLATEVRAGENRGKRLEHDFVVRDLAGPFPVGEFRHTFPLDARWNRGQLAVAAFALDARSGGTLQALALPACTATKS